MLSPATTDTARSSGLVRRVFSTTARAMHALSITAALFAAPACLIGVSAARTVPGPGSTPDTYCEPVAPDVVVCRSDDESAWRCVAGEYGWHCRRQS